MPDMKDWANVQLVIAFIVPGLIISYVRARFITGRMEKLSDSMLGYVALTVVYYGFALPFVHGIVTLPPGWMNNLAWWAVVIVGPAVLGLLLGVGAEQGWLRWLAHKLGLNPVHSTPNAWDWRFRSKAGCYVLVTLSDGGTAAGFFGTQSFASSDPAEPDLYIQELMDVPDDGGAWTPQAIKKGILIPAKEIRYVNFYWS